MVRKGKGKGRTSFVWNGEDLKQSMDRAVGRASVAWGESVVAGAKRAVHRLSSTLSRSFHAAGRGYDGSGDERAAQVGQIGSGGVGVGLKLLAYSGAASYIEAGSWISYALYEMARGGSHDFLSAAADSANRKFPILLRKAIAEEHMLKG